MHVLENVCTDLAGRAGFGATALVHKTETCGVNTNLLELVKVSSNFLNVLLFKIFGVWVVINFSSNWENLFSKEPLPQALVSVQVY